MADLKHVGRMKATGKKVLVAFRTLPGDPYSALVIPTENLSSDQHDAIINLVESNASQTAYELADVLARVKFPDGGTMLPTLHVNGKLVKVPTSDVEMVPNVMTSIGLDQLNQIIANQRGITLDDLSRNAGTEVKDVARVNEVPNTLEEVVEQVPVNEEKPLSDEDLARQLRSDADRLYKEAARLRAEAEVLWPTKKKSKETTT